MGHLVTLISVIFYSLTFIRIGHRTQFFWFYLATLGIIESFGILIFQLVSKKSLQVSGLLKDDNTQYFLLGCFFLLLRPHIMLPLLPFGLFSAFHVLAYTRGHLLPVFGLADSPIAAQVGHFVNNNNTKSIQVASLLEIISWVWLLVRVITFRKRSLTPFLVYSLFLKLRFEKSVFTRNHVKRLELRIESAVNNANNPTVKNIWIQFKDVARRIGAITLVNDYSKEKLT